MAQETYRPIQFHQLEYVCFLVYIALHEWEQSKKGDHHVPLLRQTGEYLKGSRSRTTQPSQD